MVVAPSEWSKILEDRGSSVQADLVQSLQINDELGVPGCGDSSKRLTDESESAMLQWAPGGIGMARNSIVVTGWNQATEAQV